MWFILEIKSTMRYILPYYILFFQIAYTLESTNCQFNSMCTCNFDSETQNTVDISCIGVPFYKFPNITEMTVQHMEIQDSQMMSLEKAHFHDFRVKSITAANNKLQIISENTFSIMKDDLTSLDLSYNKLDFVPFNVFEDLQNLQWLNLYGNSIQSINGDWCKLKLTLSNLFLGGNDITMLPTKSDSFREFKSLVWLNLEANKIFSVSNDSIPNSIQTLSLSHNYIESFPYDILYLPNLQWLYLRNNYITSFSNYTYPKKINLEKIDLSENAIKEIPFNLFNNSLQIHDLNLAYNKIKRILSNSFQNLKCRRIILSNNEIDFIDLDAFNNLNSTLEYLDLDHNNLQEIPKAIQNLTQLKYLYISFNSISNIPINIFSKFNSKLKALNLEGNKLNSIPKLALKNCTQLTYLNIGYNEIYEMSEEEFLWGVNLKTLLLRNNRLVHLKEKVFSNLKQLKELSLSYNPLRYVDSNAFLGLENLNSLEISFSLDWEVFPSDVLKHLTSLQYLMLDNNNFKTISNISLIDLPQLKYVSLDGNRLDLIPKGLFCSVHNNLFEVRLLNNNLNLIESQTFSSLRNLQNILLSNNRITLIESNGFHNCSNLKTILLNNNKIHKISQNAFSNLAKLNHLNLFANKLTQISFNIFVNTSLTPLILNVSNNFISVCDYGNKIVNILTFDLKNNNIHKIPSCLENISALKRLYLDINYIIALNQNEFMHLTSLEVLTLSQNNINFIHKSAFFGLENLQVLDLSNNIINIINASLFKNMVKLRILNLSGNKINFLPKDVFIGTSIEMIDLSHNFFTVFPSLSLAEIGQNLRYLLVNNNNIEHIDSMTLLELPFIQQLDLSNNKLTFLPDNVFNSLGMLQKLDISSNIFRANYKELFHYAQSLKELHLSKNGITVLPHLPLPNLVYLNISFNNIQNITKYSVQELKMLKYLYLNNNKLTNIPSNIWTFLPLLKLLDLSFNPIKEISSASFVGLTNLQSLNMNNLDIVRKFEGNSILPLRILSILSMQSWPYVENYQNNLCQLFLNLPKLKEVKFQIKESTLDEHFKCINSTKLKFVQISGRNLRFIDKDAFIKFATNSELLIQIVNTQIEELPVGLFSILDKVSHLSIDLRRNMLTYLSPDIFYSNSSSWKNVGTTLLSGGLLVSNNPWKCGCHLAWLGHWLRRWPEENPNMATSRVQQLIQEATCVNIRSGKSVPMVKLSTDDLICHASALSKAGLEYFQITIYSLQFVLIFLLLMT